jgi:hypothetical protein
MIEKNLIEFDALGKHLLVIVSDVPAGENRKVRDEIISLACGRPVTFRHIDENIIDAEVQATETTVRVFEDAGWEWA